jgi:hypothetical protein
MNPVALQSRRRAKPTFGGNDYGSCSHHSEIVETGNESWRVKNRG